jgi:hypothetical protein
VTEETLSRPELPLRGVELREGATRELTSVRWLLLLADDEPDGLVRMCRAIPWESLTPAVLGPWLGHCGKSMPAPWARVRVGFGPLNAASPLMVGWLKGKRSLRELRELLHYFQQIGDERHAAEVEVRIAALQAR